MLQVADRRAGRIGDARARQELLEQVSVGRDVDGTRRRAEYRHFHAVERLRQVDRRLPAELYDGRREVQLRAVFGTRFVFQNVQHAFFVKRLEVQAVAGVEVGRYGLWIGVRHDAGDALFVERPSRVHRAIVELDALPDAYRPAAHYERLARVHRKGFVLFFVGAVKVGRERFELGGAGVHHLVHGTQVPLVTQVADLLRGAVGQLANLHIRKSEPLRAPEPVRVQVRRQQFFFHQRDVLERAREPGVDAGRARERFGAYAAPQCVQQRPQAFVVRVQRQPRVVQPFQHRICVAAVLRRISIAETPAFAFPEDVAVGDFQRAHRFLERRLKRAVDSHHLAGCLHLRGDGTVARRELVEWPARNLHYAVVERGLERGDGLLRYGIGDFVEALAHGNLGGDSRDGIACRLACQRGAAADARVDLDDVVFVVPAAAVGQRLADDIARRERHLYVAAAFDAKRADDFQADGAQQLVFLVGERLAGRDYDAVAGMHAHRVDVLHIADGDAVVGGVSHHLVLDFLPAD